MKVLDLRDKFLLLLSAETKWAENGEIDYPEWQKVRRGIYEIISDAGDEARCAHPGDKKSLAGFCVECWRRPTPENTIPPQPSISEQIDKLRESL